MTTKFQVQVQAGGCWQPGATGTLNQTGLSDEEASTFTTEEEAKEFARMCLDDGAEDVEIVLVNA